MNGLKKILERLVNITWTASIRLPANYMEAVKQRTMMRPSGRQRWVLYMFFDKTTLAAFGIRKLRTENLLKKRLLMESKGRVKELMQAHQVMGRRGKQMKGKDGFLEGKRK